MRKKLGVLALAIVFAAALFLPLTAFAESSLGVSTTVTPAQLIEAGKVEIGLKLANNGSVLLGDVTLSIPGRLSDNVLGNLDPGEKKTFNISNFNVSAEQIGKPISFQFKWTENGVAKSLEYPITIGAKAANAQIEARRDVSKAIGASGDIITVTYALENTGDVDLTDISITDPISDKPIATGLTLAVGSAVKKVNFGLTLTKTVTSKPVIKGTGGGKEVTFEIPGFEIVMAEPKMEIQPTMGTPNGSKIPVQIVAKNTGNVTLKDISLTDEQGGQIASGLTLAAGESKTVDYEITAASARTFVVTANATAEGLEGAAASLTFLSAGVEVSPSATPNIEQALAVTASAATGTINTAGEVEFTIKLNNQGGEALKDVTLKEKTAGVIKEFPDLKMGLTTVRAKINIKQTASLSFFVEYKDASGKTKTISAEPVTVQVGSQTPAATDTPATTPTKLSVLTIIMIALGVLLVAAVAGLFIVLGQERRRKEQRMETEELDRMMERRSRTGKREARSLEEIERPTAPARPARPAAEPREPRIVTERSQRRYTPVGDETPARPRVRPDTAPETPARPRVRPDTAPEASARPRVRPDAMPETPARPRVRPDTMPETPARPRAVPPRTEGFPEDDLPPASQVPRRMSDEEIFEREFLDDE